MLFWHRSWVAVALVGFALVPSAAMGQQARRVDDAALRNASKSGEEWLTYGRDPGETRLQPSQSHQHRQCEPPGIEVVL